ncbi:FHA domain-containing protein [Streptomyces sp. MspMP-M5]|uniref:FHA domain-containing protein n=1 Tax=unclassified Streptomyces TaxID=2593676 RepID=UPI002D218762|nr:FHA domain-containing protein [Streptomyces sp. MspMP-M5]
MPAPAPGTPPHGTPPHGAPAPGMPAPGAPAPAPGPEQSTEFCPQCRTPREGMAPFCTECQYNFLTNSPASFAPPPGAPVPGPGGQPPQGGYGFPPPAPGPGGPGAPLPGPGGQPPQGGYGFPPPQAPFEQPAPFEQQAPQQPGPPPGMPGPGGHPGQPGPPPGMPSPGPAGMPGPPPPPQQGGDDWTLNPPHQAQAANAAPPMAPPQPGPGPQAPFEQQQPPAPFPPQQPQQGPDGQWGGGPGQAPAAPPQGPPPVVGDGWVVAIGPDREYFMAMMSRSGPEAAGLNLPSYSPEQVLPLAGGQVSVGRRRNSTGEAPDVDLGRTPEDPGVSHQHALLVQQQDGSWAVVDQNSTNGTTVNLAEEPIQPYVPVPLHEGDRVHVGAWTTLTVRRG